MAMTPASSLSSYLTPQDFCLRRDVRTIAQLVTDDPQNPVVPPGTSIPAAVAILAVDPRVLAVINSASGQLESAVMRSRIYQLSDLQALNGVSLEYLKKIVGDIAMFDLMTRRPGPAPSETVVDAYNRALEALEALANGVRIFSFAETAEAGVAETSPFQPSDYIRNNLISARWHQFFGNRQAGRRFW